MEIVWGRVLPVLVSISIIIVVAILREYSRTLAAVVATMPINIPLALWIVSDGSTREQMDQFTRTLFINIWPTILFLLVVWLAARSGWRLLPMLAAGYAAWGIGLLALSALRGWVGI
ncbi:MAG: hypothetical protein JNJ61_24625 [Anaerolineae bacterium]|nr:hypothetical protein [Anaerolineae bacterium]